MGTALFKLHNTKNVTTIILLLLNIFKKIPIHAIFIFTLYYTPAVDVTNKVMIDGLPPDISADVVELVYESRNTSGGGPTTSIELVEKEAGNDRGAIITFEREQG